MVELGSIVANPQPSAYPAGLSKNSVVVRFELMNPYLHRSKGRTFSATVWRQGSPSRLRVRLRSEAPPLTSEDRLERTPNEDHADSPRYRRRCALNDIVSFPFIGWNAAAYEQTLRDEFDQLYEEGAHHQCMMSISLHDRISGHANRVRSLDRFLAYVHTKPDVWFARKDEIARWALENRAATPTVKRAAPTVSGLPGSAA